MVTPGTLTLERTDLYELYGVVQNTIMSIPKEIIIGILRSEFARDSYYKYCHDEWGYPKTVDLTDKPLDAGLNDEETTRIFIGEAWHFDAVFYPALIVKLSSAKSVPISLNRNKYVIEWEKLLVVDGYGNEKEIFTPKYFDLSGAWEGSIQIDVLDRDILSRDNLLSILMIMFTDLKFEALRKAGVLVKPPSLSGVSESEDRQQEKLYKATVNIEFRSEWRRLIPIENLIEQVNFCIDFNSMQTKQPNPAFEINTNISILESIENM